jgi:hypothetical protein
VYAWQVQRLDDSRESYAGTTLRVGRVRVSSDVTSETRHLMYAVLHFGGHDFSCGIRGDEGPEAYESMKADLLRRYGQRSMADMVRGLDEYFPRDLFGLPHLFLEERRRVLTRVMQAVLERFEEAHHRIWEDSRKLVHYLRQAEAPIPDVLRVTAKHVLEHQLTAELERTPETGTLSERAFELSQEARAMGLTLDLTAVRPVMGRAVARALDALGERPAPERVAATVALIEGARRLEARFGTWHTQNRFFALWQRLPQARAVLRPLADTLGFDLAETTPS